MSVITDKNKLAELLTRGVEKIFPSREALEKDLNTGKRLKLYCGFDPSAKSLHVGNAIALNKLSQFQALGHDVIFLIGDFTGMIGDPTDKSSARRKLTREEVTENAKSYKNQASVYLDFDGDNPAQIRRNSEWSDPISFKDLIEISSNFTVQQMIQRDMFQKRLEEDKPIYLHEFLYPLAQGYDSVGMDVDLEVGGNDQMFNMLCGRDLQKVYHNKEKYVMTLKLLADDTGKKMGKSEGNAVFLDTDPNNMYGIIMSWADGVIGIAFELCTKLPMAEVDAIKAELKNPETNPRDLKMKLAYEMTRMVHGENAANSARDHFIKTVQKKEVPDEVEILKLQVEKINVIDLLVEAKLVSSKGEARRLIGEGGIRINGEVVNDINREITVTKDGALLQRGKRQFVKVVV